MPRSSTITGGGLDWGDLEGAQAEADRQWLERHGHKLGLESAPPEPAPAPPETEYIAPKPRRWGDGHATVIEPVHEPEPETVAHFDGNVLRAILDKLITAAERRGDE